MGKTGKRSRSRDRGHRRRGRSYDSYSSEDRIRRRDRKSKYSSKRDDRKKRLDSEEDKSSDIISSSGSRSPINTKDRAKDATQGGGDPANKEYELYREKRRLRKLQEEKKATSLIEGMEGGHKLRKVEMKDFPNYKRKLVVQNIPTDALEDDIMTYFFTVLSSVSKEQYNKNPIMSVIRYKELGFVTLEFRKREDAEVCLNLDGTEYQSGYKMRILRVKRFMDHWNVDLDRGRNPITQQDNSKNATNFSTGDKGGDGDESNKIDQKRNDKKKEEEEDNRLFIGGVPPTMPESEVRRMCESFGRLKNFNLVKDPQNPDQNKGYGFFEYSDERCVDKAIKALNNLDFKDKKLKVQRASTNSKPSAMLHQNIGIYKNVPDDKKMPIPMFTQTPSRVVQFLNMISIEDLFDEEQIFQVKDDLLQESKQHGEIISIEIPRPDEKGLATYGVGKIFVKFNHIVAAKQARYKMSGKKYNGRTVVVSFYPEHYFDIKEFSII